MNCLKMFHFVQLSFFLNFLLKKKHFFLGLCPSTNIENARLDMIADLLAEATNSDGIKSWPGVLLGRIQCDNKVIFI